MTNPLTRILKTALIVSFVFFMPRAGADSAADAESQFTQGVDAFRNGAYEQALNSFEHARQLGMDTQKLRYNLGVTYYRLGRYGKARSEFAWLVQDPALAPLAYYNLGLIALGEGAKNEARSYFSTAAETVQDPKLKALAEAQLSGLVPVPEDRHWFGFLDAGAGYDDNVALVPDTAVVAPTGNGDYFSELMGGFVGQLTGNMENGLRVKASAFWLNYRDLDAFDQTSARGGLAYRHRLGGWQTEWYGFGDLIYLDGDPFERIATLSWQGKRDIGNRSSLRLRARSSYIDADNSFDSLTGWRNQVMGEVRRKHGALALRGGYEFEHNDREDRSSGDEFSSVSPLRYRLFLKANWDLEAETELFLYGGYRYSRYRDQNRMVSGGTVTEETRQEDQYKVRAGIDYHLNRDWTLTGEYQYTRNDSNIDEFDYTSNRYMARIQRLFQ